MERSEGDEEGELGVDGDFKAVALIPREGGVAPRVDVEDDGWRKPGCLRLEDWGGSMLYDVQHDRSRAFILKDHRLH